MNVSTSNRDTILLVEDEAIIALHERRLLERNGFGVIAATSGEKAVEVVASGASIDLVLMDIDLGTGIDGTEAAERILEIRNLPIVFLTSHSERDYVERVKRITNYGYILKNSGEFVLIQSIEMAFNLFAANVEARHHAQKVEAREHHLEHLNRVLRSIRNINKLITREVDRDELLSKACRMLVETHGYHAAWIVLVENNTPIEPVFHAGLGKNAHEIGKRLATDPIPQCAERAYASGEAVVIRNPAEACPNCPLRVELEKIGCRTPETSTFAAALRHAGQRYGWINVIIPAIHADSADELDLFNEITGDISYALHNLRVEAAGRSARAALEASEERHRMLYENAPLAYQSLDAAGNLIDVNPAWLNTLGYTREEVIGTYFGDLLHPASQPHFAKNFPEFKRRGGVHDVRFKLRHRDGSYRDVSFEGRIGYHADGSVRQTFCVFRDISERVRAEDALRASEARYRTLFEEALSPILVVDEKGNYINANNAALAFLRCSLEELQTKRIRDFMPPPEGESELEAQEGVFHKKLIEAEYLVDGETKTLMLSIVPVELGERRVVYGIGQDITERKRAEKRLHSALHEREELMKELNHRVKNNLALVGSLIALKDDALGDTIDLSDIRNQLTAIRTVHDKLSQASESLSVEVGDYLRDVLNAIMGVVGEFTVEYSVDAPPITLPAKVVTPIGLIVNELATNALKHAFTPGRREHFSVVLSKARNGEGDSQRYTLLVSNSGEPFPPEIDFEEVPTLGLRLVSELVAQLHGELQIQRSPETRIAIEMSLTPDAGS